MKKNIFNLVVLFLLLLSACGTPANPAGPDQAGSFESVPVRSNNEVKEAKTNPEPTQGWSDAPLSEAVLLSRYEHRTNKAEIIAIDPDNGLPIASAPPIHMGGTFFNVRSPDGAALAVVAYPNVNNATRGRLHFVDLASWQESSLDFDIIGWIGVLTYSPDGRYLAIITWQSGSKIYLVDVNTKELVGQTELKDKFAKAQFTRDGSGLMLYMNRWDTTNNPEIPPSAALLLVPGLEVEWEQALSGIKHGFFTTDSKKKPHEPGSGVSFEPGVAFSPNEDKVYILHAETAHMTSVDYNRQVVTTKEIAPKMSLLERLLWLDAQPVKAKVLDGTFKKAVVSQDGKTIYVTGVTHKTIDPDNGQLELNSTPFGLQVIDAQTGTELAHYDKDAEALNLSPEGQWLFLYGYQEPNNFGMPLTQVIDPQSGEMKITLNGRLYPAYRLNGELVYVSETFLSENEQQLSVFDAQSFKQITNLASDKRFYLSWLVGPLY